MLINRRTFNVKQGSMKQVIELMKQGRELVPHDWVGPTRMYIIEIGTFDTAALELPFQDLTEYQRFWDAWSAKATEFLQEWRQVVGPGGTNEIWTLVE